MIVQEMCDICILTLFEKKSAMVLRHVQCTLKQEKRTYATKQSTNHS